MTLDDVKARGNLLCGVSTGAPGFATVDDSGKDVGFDVDYCRALAAAIFGDPMAVKFVGLTSAVRFTALAAGEVDILARNTTWTYSRDTDLKQTFMSSPVKQLTFVKQSSVDSHLSNKEKVIKGFLKRISPLVIRNQRNLRGLCRINSEKNFTAVK